MRDDGWDGGAEGGTGGEGGGYDVGQDGCACCSGRYLGLEGLKGGCVCLSVGVE